MTDLIVKSTAMATEGFSPVGCCMHPIGAAALVGGREEGCWIALPILPEIIMHVYILALGRWDF